MLKRIFFVRPLIVSVLFFLFVDVMATEGVKDPANEAKQNFLREKILDVGYNGEDFVNFLKSKKGEKADDVNNWTMTELKQVVNEFQKQNPLQVNKGKNENDRNPVYVNNNILSIKNESQFKFENEDNNIHEESIAQENLLNPGPRPFGPNFNGSINDQSSLKSPFYDLSHNKIASSFFCFYRYGGKFLASLVWSVVNSYCGFEQLVMNDWYCYAMCSGYRLQPRFMRSRVWIDMNFNFLEGIAGFLIRFFLFYPSYDMYDNIFDFFNVCIDIKVYNNLYFAVNIVGFVRSIVLLYILRYKLTSHFPEYE